MADQAHNPKGFRLHPGENVEVTLAPAKASQTWVRGDLLSIDTEQVDLAVAGDATLFGLAVDNQTSTSAGDMVPVYVFKKGTRIIGRQNAGSGSLGPGQEVDLVGGTGAMEIDENASSTDVFEVIGEVNTDETDAAGKEWVVAVNKPFIAA